MTLWMRIGTVSVATGTADVVGTGTDWNLRSVQPGFLFLGPDGKSYEIEQLISPTLLRLGSNYQGSVVAAAAYSIVPLSAAASATIIAEIVDLVAMLRGSVVAGSAKFGAPAEASAVLATKGGLVSFENAGSVVVRLAKAAMADTAVLRFDTATTPKFSMGLDGSDDWLLGRFAGSTLESVIRVAGDRNLQVSRGLLLSPGAPPDNLVDGMLWQNTSNEIMMRVGGMSIPLTSPGTLVTTAAFGTLTGAPGDNAALSALFAGKQAASATLTTLAGLGAVPLDFLSQATVAEQRTALALGTAATESASAFEEAGTANMAIGNHNNEADPHPQYLLLSEAALAFASLSHSHTDATTSAAGFMSTTDKTRLDSLHSNSNLILSGATIAQQWAVNPEDNDVDGFTGQFSALHHAAKAAQNADLANTNRIAAQAAADVATSVGTGNVEVGTFTALLGLTPAQVAVGQDVIVKALNTRYTRIGSVNLTTNSEFHGGITDAPVRAGLVSIAALSGYANSIAFGRDGTTLSFAYKQVSVVSGQPYTLSAIVEMTDTNAPVPGTNAGGFDFSLVFDNNGVDTGYTTSALGGGRYRVSVTGTGTVTGTRNFGVIKFSTQSNRTFKVTGYQIQHGSTLTAYELVAKPVLHVDARKSGGILLEVRAEHSRVTPAMFGNLTNVTDDSAVVNVAANVCADKSWTLVVDKDFCLSAPVYAKFGIRGIVGVNNATIKSLSDQGKIILPWVGNGDTAFNPTNVEIDNLVMDANGFTAICIQAGNPRFCKFTNNEIKNHPGTGGGGILIHSYQSGGVSPEYNEIHGNVYSGTIGPDGETGGIAISIDADLNLSGYSGSDTLWKALFVAPTAYFPPRYNQICNNNISGGYYGIGLSGATNNIVTGNLTRNNTRGISCQNSSNDNAIVGNKIDENKSSGIHLAYGSSRNSISYNTITSARATGEGQLQAYVASKNNTFTANTVNITAGVGPTFHINCAVHADGNQFKGNILNGPASKAHIAIESAWNTLTADPASRAYLNVVGVNNYANTGMSGVVVDGNTINGTSPVAIFLGQTSDAGGAFALTAVTLSNNIIPADNHTSQLRLVENTASNLSGLTLTRNGFFPAAATKFTLPRGWAHFAKRFDNDIIDTMAITITPGDTTPSVSVGGEFQHNDSVATLVTDYDDGGPGADVRQTILIRLSNNTTLVHSGNLRLRGDVNATGNANRFLELQRRQNFWFEMSRNF